MKYLNEYEERLVELVYLLAYGTPEEYGLTLSEIKQFLLKELSKNENVLKSLENSSRVVEDVKKHLRS